MPTLTLTDEEELVVRDLGERFNNGFRQVSLNEIARHYAGDEQAAYRTAARLKNFEFLFDGDCYG